jgi:hypothetical protein
MDAESFTELAMRVISREATDDERLMLDAEIAAVPARREEFEQLKITHEILRTTAPMTQAAQALTPGLPSHRVNELRTAVRQHFGPASVREKVPTASSVLVPILRWLFAGSSVGALAFVVVIFCFANRTVEVGLYGTDLTSARGERPLSAAEMPHARLVTFDQDAPFDEWQKRPLAWNEHAKIWVDNEHDLLYIVTRMRHGQIHIQTQPLAQTTDGMRDQVREAVESVKN